MYEKRLIYMIFKFERFWVLKIIFIVGGMRDEEDEFVFRVWIKFLNSGCLM